MRRKAILNNAQLDGDTVFTKEEEFLLSLKQYDNILRLCRTFHSNFIYTTQNDDDRRTDEEGNVWFHVPHQ